MSITFEYHAPDQASGTTPQTWAFGDNVRLIRLGRDPAKCDVALLSQSTAFGREHCTLVQQAGRYALQLDSVHRVFWCGKEVLPGETLEGDGELRLGIEGPILKTRIVSNSDLPPTDQSALGESPVRRVAAASQRGVWLGLASLLAIAVSGVLCSYYFKDMWTQIEVQQSANSKQEKQIRDAIDLASDAAKRPPPTNWAEVFDQVAPSIGLVMIRDADGTAKPLATAWSVDQKERLFATNAHVGKLVEQLRDTQRLIVRSPGPKPLDFEITNAVIHPGYDAFISTWSDFAPCKRGGSTPEPVGSAGAAYDVALLQASKEGPQFPAALPLADDSTLEKLAAGQGLGSIGFPMEGLSLGGVNAQQPVPIRHLAYVAANTDYFGRPGNADNPRHLVQHAIPSTGGASGSPILNDRGQVVAVHNAGNVIGTIEGVRVEASAQIFFSQRADLVGELLGNAAAARQDQRIAAWTQSLRAEYVSAVSLLRPAYLDDAKILAEAQFSANELVSAGTSDPIRLSDPTEGSTPGTNGRWSFVAPETGRYLAFAFTENSNAALTLEVHRSNADVQRSERSDSEGWRASTTFLAAAGETIALLVEGGTATYPVALEVRQVRPADIQTERLVQDRIENWLLRNDAEVIGDSVDRTLEAEDRQFTLDVSLDPGSYLYVVVPPRYDAIKVDVRDGELNSTESRLGLSLWGRFDVADAQDASEERKVTFNIVTLESQKCQLKVVKIKPSEAIAPPEIEMAQDK
jgi:type II secretory pathway pseudopilin PulG